MESGAQIWPTCRHRGETEAAAFAGWAMVKVAEASWMSVALSSWNETALSLARVIAGSGVSSKLRCLCDSVPSFSLLVRRLTGTVTLASI